MRKWVFIILPVIFIALFLAIDNLILSSEYSYMNTHRIRPYEFENKASSPPPSSRKDKVNKDNKVTKRNKRIFTPKNNTTFKEEPGSAREPGRDIVPASSHKKQPSRVSSMQTGVASLSSSSENGDEGLSFVMETPPSVFFSLEFINEQIL